MELRTRREPHNRDSLRRRFVDLEDRMTRLVAIAFGLAATCAAVACTQNFEEFEPTASSGSGGASMSTSSSNASASTSSSSASSSSSGGSCNDAASCDDKNPCTEDACTAGKCVHTALANGEAPIGIPDNPTDCLTPVCNKGLAKNKPADMEVPDDMNPCTTDLCMGGTPKHTPLALNTACGEMLVCDDAGHCVGCNSVAQCPNAMDACHVATCSMHTCGIANAQLGASCPMGVCDGLGACVECNVDNDCQSQAQSVCEVATHTCVSGCMDQQKDGAETDVDCGGGVCSACADGKKCQSGSDCASSVCKQGSKVCQAPSCFDSVKNGTETDVDCGGSCNAKCSTNKACQVNADCSSNSCVNSKCQSASCFDSMKNGTETDVDCGGSCMAKCGVGKNCQSNSDCSSFNCNNGTCGN